MPKEYSQYCEGLYHLTHEYMASKTGWLYYCSTEFNLILLGEASFMHKRL